MDRHASRSADGSMERPSEWADSEQDQMIVVGERLAVVAQVDVAGPLALSVRFDDGVEGTVRFEDSSLNGLFAPLSDPDYFAKVGIANGAVSWPNEMPDLSPDNMHRHLKQDGEWVLT